jgi:GDP-L-fucose synthase
MRVLITGGTGFLGKHLQQFFNPLKDKYELYFVGRSFNGKNCQLEKQEDCAWLFDAINPDIVVHAAALCGGIGLNKKRPADLMLLNMQMNCNVLEQCLKHKVELTYTLGSVCAYPVNCPVPFKEDDIWEGFPEATNSGYAVAKKSMMLLFQSMKQQYGMKGAHLIPVNMYGPYDHFDLENSHVIPALIRKFVEATENNLPQVFCWGTGNATREFFYAGDCAEAIVQAVGQRLDTYLPINLGTGTDISIRDLSFLIAELTGFRGEIVFTGEVSDGQPKRRLDVSRAKELLSFSARTKLIEGLKKTINWYKGNKPTT